MKALFQPLDKGTARFSKPWKRRAPHPLATLGQQPFFPWQA